MKIGISVFATGGGKSNLGRWAPSLVSRPASQVALTPSLDPRTQWRLKA
jgi:hypothetical protein